MSKYFECIHCEKYSDIYKVKLRVTSEIIYLCQECDTVYPNFPEVENSILYEEYMEQKGIDEPWNWDHLIILKKHILHEL